MPFGNVGWLDTSIKSLDSEINSSSLKITNADSTPLRINQALEGPSASDATGTSIKILPLFDFDQSQENSKSGQSSGPMPHDSLESQNMVDLEAEIRKSFIIRQKMTDSASSKSALGSILSYVTGGLSDSVYSKLFTDGSTSLNFDNLLGFKNSPGFSQYLSFDTRDPFQQCVYDCWSQDSTVRFSKQSTPGFFVVADWPRIDASTSLVLYRNKLISETDDESVKDFSKIGKLVDDLYKAKGFRVNRYHADLVTVYTSNLSGIASQREDYDADITIRRFKISNNQEEEIVCPDEFKNEFINGTIGSSTKYEDSEWPGLEMKTHYSLPDILMLIAKCYGYRKASTNVETVKKVLSFENTLSAHAKRALAYIDSFVFAFNQTNPDEFWSFDNFKEIENKSSLLKNEVTINQIKGPIKYGDMIKLLSCKTWRHLYGAASPIKEFDSVGKINQGVLFSLSDYDYFPDKLGVSELQSWWIIKGPHDSSNFLGNKKFGDPVKNGDVIRLENALTGKNIHMTPSINTFYSRPGGCAICCLYGRAGQGDANDNFTIRIKRSKITIDQKDPSKEDVEFIYSSDPNCQLTLGSVFDLSNDNKINGKRVALFADYNCLIPSKSSTFSGLETVVGAPIDGGEESFCWTIDSFRRDWANYTA